MSANAETTRRYARSHTRGEGRNWNIGTRLRKTPPPYFRSYAEKQLAHYGVYFDEAGARELAEWERRGLAEVERAIENEQSEL